MSTTTGTATEPASKSAAEFVSEWERWHAQHEAARASEHGFLAVTSLNWLATEPRRYPDVPGAWSTGDGGPVVELAESESLEFEGRTLTGRHAFGPIPERGGVEVTFGDAVAEVARRGSHDILRPRHPENPLRRDYTGTPAFSPEPAWRVEGEFVPFPEPRSVTVGSVAEGLEHVYEAPGEVRFRVGDDDLALTVFNGHVPGSYLALFRDATSGVTTYAANRSVSIAAPDAASRVVVDFNRATNLPCAYTDYATCPLPPAENLLPIAIEAGEKTPHERTTA
ncbi:MAG: DUF1684 domain-containing protein [Herbiconiux sp.]|uniref:DUF1684 domain-containing protein n=1 Tax=Herbiconiux sp. TaxID=1871186 RepID=UPI00122A49F9|nr:DUF1684 domain-containing protein [Herbiconiux sp.]TAJ50193.1 MAG: DUF1684 domain-containing protein [Herbiconiux sp.]